MRRVLRLALQLALDEADRIGRDAREKLATTFGRRNDVVAQELLDRAQQLVDRRTVLHQKPFPSIRFSSSHSVSAVRRPMLASSTLFDNPSRNERTCTSVNTPQRRFP